MIFPGQGCACAKGGRVQTGFNVSTGTALTLGFVPPELVYGLANCVWSSPKTVSDCVYPGVQNLLDILLFLGTRRGCAAIGCKVSVKLELFVALPMVKMNCGLWKKKRTWSLNLNNINLRGILLGLHLVCWRLGFWLQFCGRPMTDTNSPFLVLPSNEKSRTMVVSFQGVSEVHAQYRNQTILRTSDLGKSNTKPS